MARSTPGGSKPSPRPTKGAKAPPRARKAPPRPAQRAKVPQRARTAPTGPGGLTVADLDELEALRARIERSSRQDTPPRWNADPEDVQRSVLRLVLTLVEFIRRLLERQAIRRLEAGTLTEAETEDLGRALMLLETTVRDLTVRFGLKPEDLNLDLGPLGKIL